MPTLSTKNGPLGCMGSGDFSLPRPHQCFVVLTGSFDSSLLSFCSQSSLRATPNLSLTARSGDTPASSSCAAAPGMEPSTPTVRLRVCEDHHAVVPIQRSFWWCPRNYIVRSSFRALLKSF